MSNEHASSGQPRDFLRQIVAADLEAGRYPEVVTRFPPEPNGYLHLGHVKSICLNFGIAEEFGGRCHLRYDDTNPEKESEEYARSMQEDIRWLGFDWGEHLYYASDYFQRMYDYAEDLIRKGLAYVDSQPLEAIREQRGTVTEPGAESPYRNRPVEENLDLFRRMRAGEFPDGAHVLRAKIDMASPNMIMRDPVLYRIRHLPHYRQGDAWCIYPMYDYAHCLEDAIEGVTHSFCTIEFENNRELYDWVLEHVGFTEPRPHQYEFAPLELEHTVLSKRRIGPLVREGVVWGWDDPRLATVRGLRRRGIPPEALRRFMDMVGVARARSVVDLGKFEHAIRETLNPVAPRVMAVLDPLRVVLTNFPEDETEWLEAPYFPPDVGREGSRRVPFARELYIDRSDFSEDPPRGYRRLVPGGEVRLRYAYVIRCDEVVKDDEGRVVELRCSYDPDTRGGRTPDGRKVKGTIQWVSARHGLEAEVRLFHHLFRDAEPDEVSGADDAEAPEAPGGAGEERDEVEALLARVNPDSLVVISDARVEPSVAHDPPDTRYQFERVGYFWRDPVDGVGERLVFNRIVGLKDTWSRKAASPGGAGRGEKAKPADAAEKAQPSPPPAARRPELDPEAAARAASFREMGVGGEAAAVLATDADAAAFFSAALEVHPDAADVAAWVVTDLRGAADGPLAALPFGGEALGRLVRMVAEGSVTRRAAKDVLARMVAEGGEPADWVERLGLRKMSDEAELGSIVDEVLARWPEKVAEYRAGRTGLLGMFVGEVMKATSGSADPRAARRILEDRLSGGGE